MKKTLLITGYTGMVAQRFLELYKDKYHLRFLTTQKKKCNNKDVFYWNTSEMEMDVAAVKGIDGVLHLSGFSIFSKWSDENKKLMYDSRVKAAELIFREVEKAKESLSFFISNSAIGYYGYGREGTLNEDSSAGEGFVAELCRDWEEAGIKFETLDARVVIPRISLVLSKSGGTLAQMGPVFKLGIGSPIGSGKQAMPWIHIDDLCHFFDYSIESKNVKGAYNMVAPESHTMRSFSKQLAQSLRRPFFMPSVPAFAIKMVFNDRATLILDSPNVVSNRLSKLDFKLKYTRLSEAFDEIYD